MNIDGQREQVDLNGENKWAKETGRAEREEHRWSQGISRAVGEE